MDLAHVLYFANLAWWTLSIYITQGVSKLREGITTWIDKVLITNNSNLKSIYFSFILNFLLLIGRLSKLSRKNCIKYTEILPTKYLKQWLTFYCNLYLPSTLIRNCIIGSSDQPYVMLPFYPKSFPPIPLTQQGIDPFHFKEFTYNHSGHINKEWQKTQK